MDRAQIDELHYILPVRNVGSVRQRGIICHQAAKQLDHVSVASSSVQARRAVRRIPGGLPLHQYVNLYFNGRNAMLFLLLNNYDAAQRVAAEDLAILRVSPAVVDLPGVVITDINAAADVEPRWYSLDEGLQALDWSEIQATSWNHSDPIEKRRHMQRMMAEALVPHRVGPEYIFGAYSVSRVAAETLRHVDNELPVEVKPVMFFRGGAS